MCDLLLPAPCGWINCSCFVSESGAEEPALYVRVVGCTTTFTNAPDDLAVTIQLKDIGSGNFGVAKLMRYKPTGELVAVKFIERGDKVSRKQHPLLRPLILTLTGPAAAATGCLC